MAPPPALREGLSPRWRSAAVHWFARLPSTNAWFHSKTIADPTLVVANEQTAGQGQRGRAWHSPAGGLYWSVGYPVTSLPSPVLSLAIAAALCDQLHAAGYLDVRVKWPNDLVAKGAKLGGILVETMPNGPDRWLVVVGVGVNQSSPALAEQPPEQLPDRAMIGLNQLDQSGQDTTLCDRDALIGQLASAALDTLAQTPAQLTDRLSNRWSALDALAGQTITLAQPSGAVISGTAQGIAADGGLRVRTPSGEQIFYSGECRVISGWQTTEALST